MNNIVRLDGLLIMDTEVCDRFYAFCKENRIFYDFEVHLADSVGDAMRHESVQDLTSEDAMDYVTDRYNDDEA